MNLNQKITKVIAVAWILFLTLYASSIIGTLAHELKHKSYSFDPKVIEVNYDGSGKFYGATFLHSHEWVYLNGYMVEVSLHLISLICILILITPPPPYFSWKKQTQ